MSLMIPKPRVGCGVEGCQCPIVRDIERCRNCEKFFCFLHTQPSFHKCPPQKVDDTALEAYENEEIERLLAMLPSDEDICRLASSLHEEIPCTIEHLKPGSESMRNYHARINFSDGSRWMFRTPVMRSKHSITPEMYQYIIHSEFATLRFLETTKVPAPKAIAWRSEGDVSYLLMEELAGTPWFCSDADSADVRDKVRDQLADILRELERHPFDRAGSLIMNGEDIEIAPCASDRFLILDQWGPFDSAIDYYTAWAEEYLKLIAARQIFTKYSVNAYLLYSFLKDKAPSMLAVGKTEQNRKFYLTHVDNHDGHILTDKNSKITGLIDWQNARVAPRAEAFGPSGWTDYETAGDDLMAELLENKGAVDLARDMGGNEFARRYFWGLEPGSEKEWKEDARFLANSILRIFGGDEWDEKWWETWKEEALKKYGDDDRLKKLMQETHEH